MSRDVTVYENPEEFNPRRYFGISPEQHPGDYVFGHGRRYVCSTNLNTGYYPLCTHVWWGKHMPRARSGGQQRVARRLRHRSLLRHSEGAGLGGKGDQPFARLHAWLRQVRSLLR